jgi:hypothetical protein
MPRIPDTFGNKPGLQVLLAVGASGIGRAISDPLIPHGATVHICDVSDEFLSDCTRASRRRRDRADVFGRRRGALPTWETRTMGPTRSSTMRELRGRPAASRRLRRPNGVAPSTSASPGGCLATPLDSDIVYSMGPAGVRKAARSIRSAEGARGWRTPCRAWLGRVRSA